MEIVIKAWSVWHEGMLNDNPHLGYTLESLPVVYANSPGDAKAKSTDVGDYEIEGRPHDYTDLRVRRAKKADKVRFEGRVILRSFALEILEERDRINKRVSAVQQYPNDTLFYIQNGFVGNCVLFWAKDGCGYTTNIDKAQTYTKQEVLTRFARGRAEDLIWAAEEVENNIVRVVDSQYLDRAFVT